MRESFDKIITDRNELNKLIKIDELEAIINKLIGIPFLTLNINYKLLYKNGKPDAFVFDINNELIEYCGLLQETFSSCKLNSSNNSVSIDENGNLRIWVTFHFYYKYHTGGSNGSEFASFIFENGKWTYSKVKK